jgi:hypothetical protein
MKTNFETRGNGKKGRKVGKGSLKKNGYGDPKWLPPAKL